MIPIVPDSYLEVLEAPVPCLLGLRRPPEKARKLDPSMFTQETLIVLLDTNELVRHSARPLPLPKLSNMRENVQRNYDPFFVQRKEFLASCLITEEMKRRVEGICKTIEISISNSILRYIPVVLPCASNGQVDLPEVKKRLEGQIKPVDEAFASMFFETQMFAQFLNESSKRRHSISRPNHYVVHSHH